jgi:hypothetical protein
MATTYRITIEYTTTDPNPTSPDYWDWPDILDLDPTRETFGVWVREESAVNEDHVREINKENEFANA